MRRVKAQEISRAVSGLCLKANFVLRSDVRQALARAYAAEANKRARGILKAIIDNAAIAQREKLAICQDTGMPVVYVEVGQGVAIAGDLKSAIQKGIKFGYKKGYLRDSIVSDPLSRGTPKSTPAVLHTDIVKGNKIKITMLPKGFGCENKSQLKMCAPTVRWEQIKQYIIDAVKNAGPDACPPYVVGVGIGGNAEYACFLAKKALLRKLSAARSTLYATLESDLLREINKLKIGPMGLGGKTSALAVHIETYPTHIAGLPVAVNISCHALRSASVIL